MMHKTTRRLATFSPILACMLLAVSGCNDRSATEASLQQQLQQLSQGIGKQQYAVQANELADRVIARRGDHLLIDLRGETTQRIKTAELRSAAELLSDSGRAALPAGRDIILVSENGGQAAQTTTLLRLHGINAFYLDGGHAAWARSQGNVSGAADTTDQAAAMAKQQAVSCWFEGDYVAAAGLAVKPGTGSQAKGFTPQLKPASQGDSLGLGLGLGLGPEPTQPTKPAANDGLGLGLGLGLGPGLPAQPVQSKPKPRLLIGEGC